MKGSPVRIRASALAFGPLRRAFFVASNGGRRALGGLGRTPRRMLPAALADSGTRRRTSRAGTVPSVPTPTVEDAIELLTDPEYAVHAAGSRATAAEVEVRAELIAGELCRRGADLAEARALIVQAVERLGGEATMYEGRWHPIPGGKPDAVPPVLFASIPAERLSPSGDGERPAL
jgi:hypothetical protein